MWVNEQISKVLMIDRFLHRSLTSLGLVNDSLPFDYRYGF